jgi:hypothetical protein
MQAVVVAEVTARKLVPAVAELAAVAAEQEITPTPTVIIDKYQPVTLVTANQEPVEVAELADIMGAFHTALVVKVVLEL